MERVAQAVEGFDVTRLEGDRATLAPQIEKALDGYLDLAQAKMVAVLPLCLPQS